MKWLERHAHLFKSLPETNELDIDEALEVLRCVSCGGSLEASLAQLSRNQEAWDFRCRDVDCESHESH